MLAPHKAACRDWAHRMYAEDALVLDTETTGFGPSDVVLEIAVARLRTGRIVWNATCNPIAIRKEETYLLPGNTVKASHIHRLTVTDLLMGMTYSEVENQLRILHGKTLIAYNAPFDRRLLEQSFEEDLRKEKWECAMQASINGFPELIIGNTGRIKLSRMCNVFGITEGQHSAYSDVIATCELIKAFANL